MKPLNLDTLQIGRTMIKLFCQCCEKNDFNNDDGICIIGFGLWNWRVCANCRKYAEKAKQDTLKNLNLERFIGLYNSKKNIKVKRSNGSLEDGWSLCYDFVLSCDGVCFDLNKKPLLCVTNNKNKNMTKKISIDEFFDANGKDFVF
jgi:hypothetical protein